MRVFAPFTKTETLNDGTLYIEGVASSEEVDSDGEVVRADAIKNAIAGYTRFGGSGALRYMHQPGTTVILTTCYGRTEGGR